MSNNIKLDLSVLAKIEAIALASVQLTVDKIVMESLRECPLDEGDLRDSIYQEVDMDSMGNISVEIGYKSKYAVRQHEDLSFNHSVGKAKFLEDPLKKNEDALRMNLISGLKGII